MTEDMSTSVGLTLFELLKNSIIEGRLSNAYTLMPLTTAASFAFSFGHQRRMTPILNRDALSALFDLNLLPLC